MNDSDNNSQRNLQNDTRDQERVKERPWLTHSWGGNLQGNDNIWWTPYMHSVCVLFILGRGGGGCTSVILHTHKHSEWHCSFLAMLVMFFIFSTDRVSSPRFSSQKCSATQLPVTGSSFLPLLHMQHRLWSSVLKWSWSAALAPGGSHSEWENWRCLVNLWRIWNCQVIVMLCDRFKRIQKQLLVEDQN